MCVCLCVCVSVCVFMSAFVCVCLRVCVLFFCLCYLPFLRRGGEELDKLFCAFFYGGRSLRDILLDSGLRARRPLLSKAGKGPQGG